MSLKELLLSEATAFDYIPSQTTKDATANDTWTFDSGSQVVSIKANNLTTGRVLAYRKSARPVIFHMFTSVNGKTSRVIKNIKKPLNAVATIARIIADEISDNKLCKHIIFRVPSVGISQTIGSIGVRYMVRHGLKFRLDRIIASPDAKYDYVVFSKGTEEFDSQVHFKIIIKPVTVDQPASDEAVEIDGAISQQIRKFVPPLISIKGIVGNDDVPDAVIDLNARSPSVYDKIRDGKVLDTMDLEKKFREDPVLNRMQTSERFGIKLLDSETFQDDIAWAARQAVRNGTGGASDEKRQAVADIVSNVLAEADEVTLDDILTDNYDHLKNEFAKYDKELTELGVSKFDIMSGMFSNRFRTTIEARTRAAYKRLESNLNDANKTGLISYMGKGYSKINGFLLNGTGGDSAANLVAKIDKAFVNCASYLPKGIRLFRGMTVPDHIAVSMAEQKLFHFRTIVSTSLSPVVGFGFGGPGFDTIGLASRHNLSDDDIIDRLVNTSMVISDAHKIPVIVPGPKYSKFDTECEVILPRGTTVKIEKMGVIESRASKKSVRALHIQASAIAAEEIDVNEAIYDGDAFFATGKLVEMRSKGSVRSNNFKMFAEKKGKDSKDLDFAEIDAYYMFCQGAYLEAMSGSILDRANYEELRAKYNDPIV